MKIARWIIAAAAIAFAVPAHAAVNDSLKVLYLFSGGRDTGDASNVGVATSVHCTSFSGVTENVQFIVKDRLGATVGNQTTTIGASSTVTGSTHATVVHTGEVPLNAGTAISQGTVAVLSTTLSMTCTAQVLDASSSVPNGWTLHGTRFNPIPGTLE